MGTADIVNALLKGQVLAACGTEYRYWRDLIQIRDGLFRAATPAEVAALFTFHGTRSAV